MIYDEDGHQKMIYDGDGLASWTAPKTLKWFGIFDIFLGSWAISFAKWVHALWDGEWIRVYAAKIFFLPVFVSGLWKRAHFHTQHIVFLT